MKLVLSRKGFDSQYGGIASPILPDGRMIALPIPSKIDSNTLADINFPDVDVKDLIADLSQGRLCLDTKVHLDPDLDRGISSRLAGWRPALGQTAAAQSHLAKNNIGAGDVFLFFGWFRQVEFVDGSWRYIPSAPDLHVMFGWLEVEHVLPIITERDSVLARFPWIVNHPHVSRPDWYTDKRNSLYVANSVSRFVRYAEFGAGRFSLFRPCLQLTKSGCSRSVWSLPSWFIPNGRPSLTYHGKSDRWIQELDSVTLQSVAKGQEFVIDGKDYPELEGWVSSIIDEAGRRDG